VIANTISTGGDYIIEQDFDEVPRAISKRVAMLEFHWEAIP
jgi:hypothetical protein